MEGLDQALQSLLHDQQLIAIFVLVALDIVLGVAAAIYPKAQAAGTFNFGKLGAFLHDDVLGKVVPWATLYVFGQLYSGLDVLGVPMDDITTGIFVVVVAALINSMYASLQDFGLPIPSLGGVVGRPVPPSEGGATGGT